MDFFPARDTKRKMAIEEHGPSFAINPVGLKVSFCQRVIQVGMILIKTPSLVDKSVRDSSEVFFRSCGNALELIQNI